jgi:hypothetical protein
VTGRQTRVARQVAAAVRLAGGTIMAAVVAPVPAAAASWIYTAAADVHAASITDRDGKLEVRCKGRAVEIAFHFATAGLDAAMQERPSAIFGLTVDNSDQVLWVQTKFVMSGAETSIGFGGAAADQTARALTIATRKVAASLMTEPPSPATPQYNRTEFPLDGAADAIKAAFAGCGIAY